MNTDSQILNVSNEDLKNERTVKPAFVFLLAIVFSAAVDLYTKHLAVTTGFGEFLNTLSPYVQKKIFYNANFVFSLPVPVVLMYIVYVIVIAIIIYYLCKNFHYLTRVHIIGWGLILGGALSNIGERIMLGSVRDFIYIFSGIFNFADLFIILGIVLLLFRDSGPIENIKV
jgi:signal peptidase II